MKYRRYQLTLGTKSKFIKTRVTKDNGDRHTYYMPKTITPKDSQKLSPRNRGLVSMSHLWPLRTKEFNAIKKNLNTIIKYKTEI